MLDHEKMLIPKTIDELTPELKKFLNETRSKLKGHHRREFMANVVLLLGRGGQSRAELACTAYFAFFIIGLIA